jgi:AcrR family transcriptional regulator
MIKHRHKIADAPATLLTPPKQGRSRETLKRLLDATRELLDDKNFDDISIAEIAKQGGSSVGAFYARFKDKDMLLDHLAVLYVEDVIAWDAGRDVDKGRKPMPLNKVIRETVTVLVSSHRRHRGALRAILLRSMRGRGSAQIDRARAYAGPPAALVGEIKKRRGEINHPNPDTAVRLALAMVTGLVRERVLFPELDPRAPDLVPITDAVLVEELTRAVLGFLGVEEG